MAAGMGTRVEREMLRHETRRLWRERERWREERGSVAAVTEWLKDASARRTVTAECVAAWLRVLTCGTACVSGLSLPDAQLTLETRRSSIPLHYTSDPTSDSFYYYYYWRNLIEEIHRLLLDSGQRRQPAMSALLERLALSYFWDWRWITTALVFAVSYFVGRFYHRVSKYPRGPFPLPLVGNLLNLRKVNLATKASEWSKVYGDVFTLWMSHRPMVFLNSYDVIREAFLDRRHEFAGRFPTKMSALQNQGNHDIMFEDYNPRWKALRKVALLAVRKYAVSESLEKLSTEVVDDYVDSLKEGPQVVESREPFLHILFTLIGVSVYGTTVEEAKKDVKHLEEINRRFFEIAPDGLPSDVAPWLGILYRRREKAIERIFHESFEFSNRLFSAAEATYAPGKTENFTHAMLSAREDAIREEKGDAEYLTKGNMVQVVVNIFGAATDTSAGELQWLFLMMAKEPWIQEKIKKEIEDNIGSTPPVYKDREKMPFTLACLMETLRCFPVAPIGLPHNTTTDTKIGELELPKDTGIIFNAYGVNHDPNLWDEPEKFRPERFLDPVTGKLRRDPLPLVTFGMGPRTCPGEKLAHVDMFYILVRLLQRLTVSAGEKAPNVDARGLGSNIFMLPAKQTITLTRSH